MELQRTFEIVARHVIKWADLNNAGVINQDVDLAEPIDNLVNGRANLLTIEQIAWNRQHLTAAAASYEILFRSCQLTGIARDQGNAATLSANVSRQYESEPTRTACNDGNLIVERIASRANKA